MSGENIAEKQVARLVLALQAGGLGTWHYDVASGILSWGPAAAALLGLADDTEPSIQAVVSAIHPDDENRLRAEVLEALGKGGRLHLEGRVVWPDASVHWLAAQGQVFYDEHGPPAAAAGVVADVTGQKQLGAAREQTCLEAERQRELLRRLVQNAPTGIAVIDARTGCYVLANFRYEANAGPMTTPGSFIGRRVGDFAPPELAKFMRGVLEHVVRTRQPFQVRQFEANFGPGREHTWWDNDVVPLLDAEGNVESVLAITNEVTEEVLARKRIEELVDQLQAGRDELEAVINSMSEGLIVMEPNGHIVSINPAAQKLHGISNPAAVPDNIAEYPERFDIRYGDGRPLPPDEWPVNRRAPGELVTEMELHGRRLDTGQSWIASYSTTPVRDSRGGVRLLVVAIHDLTAIKQAQQQMQRLMADLERSNKDLELFATVASHDLQEPLRVVTLYLELLKKQYAEQLSEAARTYVAQAVGGAEQTSAMIKDLLAYSRAGTRGIQPVPIDLRSVLEAVKAALQATIEQTGALVTAGPLPVVTADPTQMHQLLQNLIGNALKFRGENRRPQVHVSATPQADHWLFQVQDNGIGLDPKDAGRAFQPFQRLHGHENYPGMGMGLAICQKIIDRHGGRIWVESEVGKGSTFYFTLPSGNAAQP